MDYQSGSKQPHSKGFANLIEDALFNLIIHRITEGSQSE
jgi:hypothetical protein